MPTNHAQASSVIPAPAHVVYAILADYHRHGQVLPPKYFTDLTVEAGGIGAGTVFRVTVRSFGRATELRMTASEPEPGRVLVERDLASDLATTFTVDPVGDGQQCRVQIATDWAARPGLAGWLDRLFTPLAMRRVYGEELRLLARYVGAGGTGT
jgi:hypothetical protein